MSAHVKPVELRTWLKWIQRVFAAIAIIAIATYLVRNRTAVAALFLSAQLPQILLAIGVMAIVHLIAATGFHFTHLGLGVRRPYRQSLGSYLVRLPARYIPGGVWHTAARYLDIHAQQTLPKRAFFNMFLVETSQVGISGLAVAGLSSSIWSGDADRLRLVGIVASAIGAAILIGLMTCVHFFRIRLNARPILAASLLFVLTWIVMGAGFAIYATALTENGLVGCSAGVLASAYELAASLGYVAIFSPQGWGVTEFAFGSLQTCNASLATGVAMIAGFRLVSLASDLLAYTTAIATFGICESVGRRAKIQ